jgi:hypothetical protein
MPERDPDELADQREKEADQLEQRGDRLQDQVDEVRQDWERKRADQGVPGAPPHEGDSDDGDGGDEPAGSDEDG